MLIIRRVYAYLLTLVGLALMCGAAANLGQLFVDVLVRTPLASNNMYVRDTVARNGAAALVGVVVWAFHWRWVAHLVGRSDDERRSTLRGLFLYLVLSGATLTVGGATRDILEVVLATVLGIAAALTSAETVLKPVPFLIMGALVGMAHWRVAAHDRALLPEGPGTATLRRWYLYAGAFIAVAFLEASLQSLLATAWRLVLDGPLAGPAGIASSAPAALVALAVWLLLWRVLPDRLADRGAALRSVYLFGGSALGITGALLGCSQILYYGLARALGVDRPGGADLDIRAALGDPLAAALVYGAGWAYFRRALRDHAEAFAEARGAIGVARLYRYLVALVALSITAAGLGGLLWTLGDVLTGVGDATPSAVRDRLALFVTLIIVAGPVWPVHWRPVPADPSETRSLARRLYLYLSVIGAALTLVGSGAVVLYRLFGLVLGGATPVDVNIDLAHALGLAVVGALVGAYHGRMLRADGERDRETLRPSEPSAYALPVSMTVQLSAADAKRLDSALGALRAMDVQVTVIGAHPPA
ncbi:MAG: hypothetical protein NVSMB2_14090 [Chloroflexota bacterium]